jgi:hypothetical protein
MSSARLLVPGTVIARERNLLSEELPKKNITKTFHNLRNPIFADKNSLRVARRVVPSHLLKPL